MASWFCYFVVLAFALSGCAAAPETVQEHDGTDQPDGNEADGRNETVGANNSVVSDAAAGMTSGVSGEILVVEAASGSGYVHSVPLPDREPGSGDLYEFLILSNHTDLEFLVLAAFQEGNPQNMVDMFPQARERIEEFDSNGEDLNRTRDVPVRQHFLHDIRNPSNDTMLLASASNKETMSLAIWPVSDRRRSNFDPDHQLAEIRGMVEAYMLHGEVVRVDAFDENRTTSYVEQQIKWEPTLGWFQTSRSTNAPASFEFEQTVTEVSGSLSGGLQMPGDRTRSVVFASAFGQDLMDGGIRIAGTAGGEPVDVAKGSSAPCELPACPLPSGQVYAKGKYLGDGGVDVAWDLSFEQPPTEISQLPPPILHLMIWSLEV